MLPFNFQSVSIERGKVLELHDIDETCGHNWRPDHSRTRVYGCILSQVHNNRYSDMERAQKREPTPHGGNLVPCQCCINHRDITTFCAQVRAVV